MTRFNSMQCPVEARLRCAKRTASRRGLQIILKLSNFERSQLSVGPIQTNSHRTILNRYVQVGGRIDTFACPKHREPPRAFNGSDYPFKLCGDFSCAEGRMSGWKLTRMSHRRQRWRAAWLRTS